MFLGHGGQRRIFSFLLPPLQENLNRSHCLKPDEDSPSPGERFHDPRKAAICTPEPGRDAFHRVPNFSEEVWDAVERVPTKCEGRFMGRAGVRAVQTTLGRTGQRLTHVWPL